jgi:uncharacterized protein YbaR (Trm112 family)
MKKDILDILACPICKNSLLLHIKEENELEVITGTLECPECDQHYPIEQSIPNLIPSDLFE